MSTEATDKQTKRSSSRCLWSMCLLALCSGACGRESTPTSPSEQSFLSGTWRGTVTIQVNPQAPGASPPTSGPITWTFAVSRGLAPADCHTFQKFTVV